MHDQLFSVLITKYIRGHLSEPQAMTLWETLLQNKRQLDQFIIEYYLFQVGIE